MTRSLLSTTARARTGRWVIVLIATLALTSPGIRAVHAARASARCVPLVEYHGGRLTCYVPRAIAAAERRLPVRPVRPTGMVRRVAHQRISQILVLTGTPRSGWPGPAIAVTYVFGTPEPACSSMPGCRRGSPYFIIQETVGHIGQKAFVVTRDPNFEPGPWHLEIDLPGRNLRLTITSNTSKSDVARIGHAIIRASRRAAT
jgi:hypothetical protein